MLCYFTGFIIATLVFNVSHNNRNLDPMDGQIAPPVGYDSSNNLQDQYQHPPYIPPCKDTLLTSP